MSSFESHYESFHDIRSKIKSKLDAIESAITSLASVSNNDEIKALVISTSTIIVDVQLAVNQYEFAVSSLTAKIAEMDEESKKKEEQQLFDQKMDTSITDGGNSIPVAPVSLTSLVREKKIHYDLTLAETINRVRVISSLSNDTVPVPTPAPPSIVPPLNSSVVSSVPNGSGDNLIASPLIDESAVIGKLSDSISQIITHISSSTSRPSLSLPPIKLETFDGSDLTRWPAFRYQIDQLVLKQPSLSEVEKAYHLRSSLKGNAFNLVASIPVHENFLNKIVSRLESQYGRHNLTQAKLIQSLRKIRSKSLLVTDHLSAVQSMISIAHSIHAESGVDALYVQQMLAEFDPVAKIYETTERESRKVADEMVTKHFDDTVQLRDDGYYVKYALKPERLKYIPGNTCRKCFRKLNESHSPTCEPDLCRRGCVNEAGKPHRHMEWFCPKNPNLEP
ncbi:hypothetical protein PRIPAC_97915 [Pristionchus pacificus]|uniref:Uncharacterized protein n=1 Tax=Pristionchus pacificus TaxID=54126 RepID=A0A2A6B2U9_PRIPA|nr:hypothetical protein PRIPAC_97915 [Pristionchus pacificus]|eukprot:PDM60200.1 hypothetical protein PRIPAC_54025 [Pristionchus pacificus]